MILRKMQLQLWTNAMHWQLTILTPAQVGLAPGVAELLQVLAFLEAADVYMVAG